MNVRTKSDTCSENRQILADLEREKNDCDGDVARLSEQLALRKGELAEAGNTLSRTIQEVSDGALAIGVDLLVRDLVGAVRDGLEAAVRLSRIEAEQQENIRDLTRQIQVDEYNLVDAERRLVIVKNEIQRTLDFLSAQDCPYAYLP